MVNIPNLRIPAVGLLALLATACASTPMRERVPDNAGRHAAAVALDQVGRPYRYGGDSPRGFDCSGLVYYSYLRAGYRIPRSVRGQRRAVYPVGHHPLHAGDLLFFSFRGEVAHVGIYVGDGRFVHAPSSGERVRLSTLANPYWRRRFIGAGRI